MGYSKGRWDGDTLVVETRGLNGKQWLDHGGLPASDKLLRHAATVGQVGPQHVTYRYDDAVELRATSGAPLVDGENHVVAINIGGGGEGGRPFGFGNPVHAFGPRLAKALAAPAAAPAAPAAAH